MAARKRIAGSVEPYLHPVTLTGLCWNRGFAPVTLREVQKATSHESGAAIGRDVDEPHGHKRGRPVDRELESHRDIAQDLDPPYQGLAIEFQRAERVQRLLARQIALIGKTAPIPRRQAGRLW